MEAPHLSAESMSGLGPESTMHTNALVTVGVAAAALWIGYKIFQNLMGNR